MICFYNQVVVAFFINEFYLESIDCLEKLKQLKNKMKFCSSTLWNSSTIYDKSPDLTECFQNSFLYWIPCFILWLLAPAWIRMVKKERKLNVIFSVLTYSKLVFI